MAGTGVVGQLLRERRLAKGLSQEQLADTLGTSQRQITRWESYTKRMPREAELTVAGTPARDLSGVAAVLPHLALLPEAEVNGVLRSLISRVTMMGKDERRVIWRPDAAAAFTGCV